MTTAECAAWKASNSTNYCADPTDGGAACEAAIPSDAIALIAGGLHVIGLVLAAIGFVWTFRYVQKKGKKAAPIDHFFVKMFGACAWVEIGMTAGVFGGFSRAFLVEGHACFDSTQVGYLNSAGTSWCKLTGFAVSQRLRRS